MVPIIEVKNLIKSYNKSQANAVDGISFTVGQGEFFALLGPNGAGKTTAISILTTTLSKTSGEVLISGLDLDRDATKIRRNLGIIFQNPSVDDNLTAEENVRFHAILYGLYPFRPTYGLMPQEYKNKIHDLAQLLSIDKELFNPIKSFSGGMKRKLEIIRSLMHDPTIIFLDEPTSGLDPISRANLWSYLRDVRENQHTTVFLTTHYLEEAEEADRLCIINAGKIVALGTPLEIKGKLLNTQVVLSSPNISDLTHELTQKKVEFTLEHDEVVLHPDKDNVAPLIQSLTTKLTKLDIHNPSLDDAYLQIIGSQVKNEGV